LPSGYLRSIDLAEVQQQRDARGSLIDWIWEEIDPDCESCELTRYRHAQAYQDQMLATLLQVRLHLSADAPALPAMKLPTWCDGKSFYNCVSGLLAEQPQDAAAHKALFRRKAQLVNLIGNQLDEIDEPRARAYMTCRAVLAAKIDFDATPDDRNAHRGEANRRAEQFFRVEASVGMD
jgi:hypothetical protein